MQKNILQKCNSYHAAQADTFEQLVKCTEALLPLFHEKVTPIKMIQHKMKLKKKATEHLNPQKYLAG